jgi:hypothetical protein
VATGLTVENVAKIARGNLVQKRVREVTKELDARVIEEAAADPTMLFIRNKSMKAAARLAHEVDNMDREDEGATASTRLKAAETLLSIGGYRAKEEDRSGGVVIMISGDKINLGRDIIEKNVTTMPDFVDG